MLRTLFRSFLSQTNTKAVSVPNGAKCVDASQLRFVAGGAPKGGWLETEAESQAGAPKGGW